MYQFLRGRAFGGLLLDSENLATMASNDQAILAEWCKQRDNKDGDEWRWQLEDPPDDICEAYCCVADAADAAAASSRMGGWGGGGSVVVIDRVEGGGRRDGRLVDPMMGAVDWLSIYSNFSG